MKNLVNKYTSWPEVGVVFFGDFELHIIVAELKPHMLANYSRSNLYEKYFTLAVF